MKKFLFLPFMLFALVLASCSDGSDNAVLKSGSFSGALLLENSVINNSAECSISVTGDSVSITLHSVAFAAGMPAMDIEIPGLKYRAVSGDFIITGNNIIPFVYGTPAPKFTFSSLNATVANGELELSASMSMGTIGFSSSYKPEVPVAGDKSYTGELVVDDFSKTTTIDVVFDESASTVDIVINDVKFAENMPMTLDITLKEIAYTYTTDGNVCFSGENVAPYIGLQVNPSDAYTFASVSGTIQGNSLSLSARMADNLAQYVAGKEFVFEGFTE